MYTSTMLRSPAKSYSHTPSRISRLVTTCPARRTRNSSTSNCRAVSVTSAPARHTRRPTGIDAQVAGAGRHGSPPDRRPAAATSGTRATSTGNENGLVRKSSAPVSRASASSSSPSFAVSTMIGVHSRRRRSSVQIWNPLRQRQHEVEHDQVVRRLGRPPQPVVSVDGDVDRVALGLESASHRRRDLDVVLDHEELHHPPLSAAGARRRVQCRAARSRGGAVTRRA